MMNGQRQFRAHRYASADGRLQLYARDYPAGESAESKLPLLMMHGLTRNSADFGPLIDRLGDDRRIVSVDQRGRGQSDYDSMPENYRPDVYVEDMWALLDGLALDRVVLIGTSLGGLMSILMAASRPDRIGAVVINDIGPEVEEAGLNRIRNYVGGGDIMAGWHEAAALCQSINEDAMDGFGPEDWLAFAQRTCVELPDGSVRFAYDPTIAQGMEQENPATIPPDLWPLWDAMAEIPTLVLRGAKSDILSLESVAEMERRHRAMMHVEIPGRGHAPILDEPTAVKSISEFLQQLD